MDVSQLVKEARQGSEASQKCLFDLLSDRMMLVCCRYVKSTEDAEEILLDGFYKFFKSLSSFNYQGEAALYVWLKKIMINECLMLLRKKNVFTIITKSAAEDIMLEEDALDNLSAKERGDSITEKRLKKITWCEQNLFVVFLVHLVIQLRVSFQKSGHKGAMNDYQFIISFAYLKPCSANAEPIPAPSNLAGPSVCIRSIPLP